MTNPSELQSRLADEILAYIQSQRLEPETHISEPALCERFSVSRTPVRGALALLEEQDFLRRIPRKGYFVHRMPAGKTVAIPDTGEDRLYLAIAEDRIRQNLPPHVSEADLLRRYDASKGMLRRVLQRLLREGLVERRPGRGWMFAPVLDSRQAHDESYRFRIAVEPLALLEPGYRLDEQAAARSEALHRQILEGEIKRISPVELFEINAEFHEVIAAGSGNRFFLQAVQQQNRLRRFVNYHWIYGPDRALRTCRDHLGVLAAIRGDDLTWASTLLRHHLETSSTVSPYAEQPAAPERVICFE